VGGTPTTLPVTGGAAPVLSLNLLAAVAGLLLIAGGVLWRRLVLAKR